MDKNLFYYLLMSWQLPFLLASLFAGKYYEHSKLLHRYVLNTFLVIGGVMAFFSGLAFFYGIGALGIEVRFKYSTALFVCLWVAFFFLILKLTTAFKLPITKALHGNFLKFWVAWLAAYPAAFISYFATWFFFGQK